MRHWNPNLRLSDADYALLDADDRCELWRRRQEARRFRATPFRKRKGHFARRRWLWAWVVFGGMALFDVVAWVLPDTRPIETSSEAGSSAPSTTGPVKFTACKWGGGTNCVVDGDTFYLGGVKIRMAGIDAPETHDYCCPEELALGERAATRLQSMLNSGQVSLSGIDRDEDRYGRKLRNVTVDGQDASNILISEGLARPYAGGRRPWC